MSFMTKLKDAAKAASDAMKSVESEPADPNAPFQTVDEIIGAIREKTALDAKITSVTAHRDEVFGENLSDDDLRIIRGYIGNTLMDLGNYKLVKGGTTYDGPIRFFESLRKGIEEIDKDVKRTDELESQIFESMLKLEQFKVIDSQSGYQAELNRKPKYYILVENQPRVIELLCELGHESIVKREPHLDLGNARSFGTFHKTWETYFKESVENEKFDSFPPEDIEKIKELAGYVKECVITTAKSIKKIK